MAPMSAPAAKALSLPVMTMAPMPSSASKSISAAQLVHQPVVQRIERLRAVQGDQAGSSRTGMGSAMADISSPSLTRHSLTRATATINAQSRRVPRSNS
jgi:hypothetical protein